MCGRRLEAVDGELMADSGAASMASEKGRESYDMVSESLVETHKFALPGNIRPGKELEASQWQTTCEVSQSKVGPSKILTVESLELNEAVMPTKFQEDSGLGLSSLVLNKQGKEVGYSQKVHSKCHTCLTSWWLPPSPW